LNFCFRHTILCFPLLLFRQHDGNTLTPKIFRTGNYEWFDLFSFFWVKNLVVDSLLEKFAAEQPDFQ